MWIHLLLAYHPHKLCCISPKNTCLLFTLGTRYSSCYFCSQCQTSTAASTDIKGVFKSISNIFTKTEMNTDWSSKFLQNSPLAFNFLTPVSFPLIWFGLFKSIVTPYGLFNAKIWYISKCLIINILSIFHCCHFFFNHNIFYLVIIIICLNTVIWYQVFLSNTNNLHTVI